MTRFLFLGGPWDQTWEYLDQCPLVMRDELIALMDRVREREQ